MDKPIENYFGSFFFFKECNVRIKNTHKSQISNCNKVVMIKSVLTIAIIRKKNRKIQNVYGEDL